MAHGGRAVSASKNRNGWGALVLSSAISILAFVAVPRSDTTGEVATRPTGKRPTARPATPSDRGPKPTEDPAEDSRVEPGVELAALETARRAPANVTSSNDPSGAVFAAFASSSGRIDALSLADQLVAIGPGAAPSLLHGLCGHLDLEALDEAGKGAAPDVREGALRDAWSRFSPAIRLAAIEDEADFADTDGLRVLIGLAGETEDAAAVPLVLELAGRLDALQLARPYVVEPIERALIRCLPMAMEARATAERLAELRGPLCPTLVRAATLCGAPAAWELAFAHVGHSAETELALLVALSTPGLDTRRALRDIQLEQVREFTQSRTPELRRAACVALGHARDGGSAKELVECLEDIDPLVASAARTALRAATGKDRGTSSEEWLSWLEERRRWLSEEAPLLVDTVRGEVPEQVVTGLDRLFERADARQEWTELCTDLLDSESPRVVRRAAEGLLQIGTADALIAVEQARARLSGPRLRVLESALAAAP